LPVGRAEVALVDEPIVVDDHERERLGLAQGVFERRAARRRGEHRRGQIDLRARP
jgi:hypothetical protein